MFEVSGCNPVINVKSCLMLCESSHSSLYLQIAHLLVMGITFLTVKHVLGACGLDLLQYRSSHINPIW